MSKRYEQLKEFGRSTKKPRLDITISKNRPPLQGDGRRPPLSTAATSSTSAQRFADDYLSKLDSPVKCSPENLWDDDDDDVILLATQVAEIQARAVVPAQHSAEITASQRLHQQSEITFSEFATSNLRASTSTQRLPAASHAPPPPPDAATTSDLFNDDNDEAFAMLVAEAVPQKHQQQDDAANREGETFKCPMLSAADLNNGVANAVAATDDNRLSQALSPSINIEFGNAQSAARRQLASERQIKFLMERIDALKKENTQLANNLQETKMKMESKDGESALLRDELRHMKQQIQTVKMDKILSTEAAKIECKTKIAELSKQVEAKETQLQLKSVEYSVLKMRHADETKRLEQSINVESLLPQETANVVGTQCASTAIKTQVLLRLHNLRLAPEQADVSGAAINTTTLMPAIYECVPERGKCKMRKTLFQIELEKLQKIVAELQLNMEQPLSKLHKDAISVRTIASVCRVFPEFWTYVHSLVFAINTRIHPCHDYDLMKDKSDAHRQESPLFIFRAQALHGEERVISLRRYVAILSIICQLLPTFSGSLLRYKHGEYPLLQIAIDAINNLGFSREVCEHFALLEAFAMLLNSMLRCYTKDDDVEGNGNNGAAVALLVALLKSLIFCRPSPWVFQPISSCIFQCTRIPEAIALLCTNSDKSTFFMERIQSVYRFSMDSCLLQVYCGLLEIAFPLYIPLRRKQFQLLTAICHHHVRFIHHCFDDPTKWVHDCLPNYDCEDDADDNNNELRNENITDAECNVVAAIATVDDDKHNTVKDRATKTSASSTNATTTTTLKANASRHNITSDQLNCECYIKMCLSLVTLLYQLLRQWKFTERKIEIFRIEKISKISVKLLHTIFCDNYITRLFRDSEDTTKHYLHLICKWWMESNVMLNFNEIHLDFLRKLQSSHIMPKPLSEEDSSTNVDNDLEEWYRMTKDDVNSNDAGTSADAGTSTADEKDLKLIEDAIDENKFFKGLNDDAFNFE